MIRSVGDGKSLCSIVAGCIGRGVTERDLDLDGINFG